jgi:hypothetical protein
MIDEICDVEKVDNFAINAATADGQDVDISNLFFVETENGGIYGGEAELARIALRVMLPPKAQERLRELDLARMEKEDADERHCIAACDD